ncbi:hypothetical protein BH24ACT5_BH24ACT5_21770 [soil metagenome]
MATQIRVNPESVTSYGKAAQGHFDTISETLNQLVDDCINVHYFGGNAVKFKTQAGQMAADFGNAMSRDMGACADAIRQSTSNIAASLGGQPINIEVSNKPVKVGTPQADDGTSDVKTDALDTLIGTVTTRFDTIRDQVAQHKSALVATDWLGDAKDNSVTAVSQFSTNATTKSTSAQDSLTKFIQGQIESVHTADV